MRVTELYANSITDRSYGCTILLVLFYSIFKVCQTEIPKIQRASANFEQKVGEWITQIYSESQNGEVDN